MSKSTGLKEFFGDGFFDWQKYNKHHKEAWDERRYDADKYWGGFSREDIDMANYVLPDWAIGPFTRYEGNPVFAPAESGWDAGHFGGGVHNGSIIRKDGLFYYIYRGEQDIAEADYPQSVDAIFDYVCDIGVATSTDGVSFTRDALHSPFFRKGEDKLYSFEDVNVVKQEDTYYLFCNRWDWARATDPSVSGAFLATSKDLLNWEPVGLVFPEATQIHRNPCVVQSPANEAVRIDGRFVMYLNAGLIAYSDDLVHWKSEEVPELWPGGEGCFALTDYSERHPDKIVLFTGGHHTGHFYAIGEVLFSKEDPARPLEWLPRPIFHVDPRYPWENGLSAEPPHTPISSWRDTIFFTGMTLHEGKWWMYYGGSEYYTCLATAPAR